MCVCVFLIDQSTKVLKPLKITKINTFSINSLLISSPSNSATSSTNIFRTLAIIDFQNLCPLNLEGINHRICLNWLLISYTEPYILHTIDYPHSDFFMSK